MGGTIGNGENMVNLGISFALDNTSNVNNSKVAMAKEIVELRSQVMQLTSLVNKMAAVMMAQIILDFSLMFQKTIGLMNIYIN